MLRGDAYLRHQTIGLGSRTIKSHLLFTDGLRCELLKVDEDEVEAFKDAVGMLDVTTA